jgi:hypothetical protein
VSEGGWSGGLLVVGRTPPSCTSVSICAWIRAAVAGWLVIYLASTTAPPFTVRHAIHYIRFVAHTCPLSFSRRYGRHCVCERDETSVDVGR